uniref:Uncharacterized protein n=1 Tax=Oryza glumipatula TaxID=40148 RepID=A0A0D9ZA93_9ORYZ
MVFVSDGAVDELDGSSADGDDLARRCSASVNARGQWPEVFSGGGHGRRNIESDSFAASPPRNSLAGRYMIRSRHGDGCIKAHLWITRCSVRHHGEAVQIGTVGDASYMTDHELKEVLKLECSLREYSQLRKISILI